MSETQPHCAKSRNGFTLIELLTVVAIISLLIGILLPSLTYARDQGKRLKVRTTLVAIEAGLEMFHTDFGQYPVSGDPPAIDPITDLGPGNSRGPMMGAHWLARAMVGHDFRGVDVAGRSMTPPQSTSDEISKADLENVARRGPYFEGANVVLDTDVRFGDHQVGSDERSARPVIIDDPYRSPILYYRANLRASEPFCVFGDPTNDPPESPGSLGVYRLADNQRITGRWDSGSSSGLTGWDFANTGIQPHPLAAFGSLDPVAINQTTTFYPKGKTFTGFLHDEEVLRAIGRVKPHNASTFILIDAGKDGLYGTDDDITNFQKSL